MPGAAALHGCRRLPFLTALVLMTALHARRRVYGYDRLPYLRHRRRKGGPERSGRVSQPRRRPLRQKLRPCLRLRTISLAPHAGVHPHSGTDLQVVRVFRFHPAGAQHFRLPSGLRSHPWAAIPPVAGSAIQPHESVDRRPDFDVGANGHRRCRQGDGRRQPDQPLRRALLLVRLSAAGQNLEYSRAFSARGAVPGPCDRHASRRHRLLGGSRGCALRIFGWRSPPAGGSPCPTLLPSLVCSGSRLFAAIRCSSCARWQSGPEPPRPCQI